MTTVKIDDKGGLTVPASDREALGIRPGDALFVECRGNQLIYMKAENPFDILAEDAIEEYRRGETKNLRKIAEERDIAPGEQRKRDFAILNEIREAFRDERTEDIEREVARAVREVREENPTSGQVDHSA